VKLAFLSDSVSRRAGGVFEANRQLALSLHALGDDVRVLGVADESTEEDRAAWSPVPVAVAAAQGPRRLGFAPQLGTLLKSIDPSILHSHGLWTYASHAALRWHRTTQKPHVVHPHGMLDPWALQNGRWKKRLAGLLYETSHLREAACLRALCRSEFESIRAAGFNNPVCLIPNGVTLPAHRDNAVVNAGTGNHTPVKTLLYLGRQNTKKGLMALLGGWAKARPPSDWNLSIAGWDEGGHAQELKRLATELGLTWDDVSDHDAPAQETTRSQRPAVRFPGPLFGEAKEKAYRDCSAFILPSQSEGLPMTVLEAWSHRKPVLMTAACNLPEGLAANAALEIFPSAESVAEGLRQCFSLDDHSRQTMGNNGFRLVENQFSWPHVAARLRAVNSWLVNGGQRPPCVIV